MQSKFFFLNRKDTQNSALPKFTNGYHTVSFNWTKVFFRIDLYFDNNILPRNYLWELCNCIICFEICNLVVFYDLNLCHDIAEILLKLALNTNQSSHLYLFNQASDLKTLRSLLYLEIVVSHI